MKSPLAVAALLLLVSRGIAQTTLTLDEALELVASNNLQLQQQRQSRHIADLEVAVSRGQLLPSFGISGTSSYTSKVAKFDLPSFVTGGRQVQIELGGHDRFDFAVGVRQPLFTGFRLKTEVDLAKKSLESEESRLKLLNQQTAYRVYLLFYQAQSLMRGQRVHQASLRRLGVQLDQSRLLLHAAQIMAFDTLQVYNQTLSVRIQIDQNERDQRLLELEMARLLDLAEPRPIAEVELPHPGSFDLSLDSLKQVALDNRPELESVRLAQQAARLSRRLARSTYFPTINAEAAYHFAKPGLNQVADEWMNYGSVGLNLQWNLWRGEQDRNRVKIAEAQRSRLNLAERDLLRSIEVEVERKWEDLRFDIQQIQLARELRTQQTERYRIVTAQHREGVTTTNDVVVAETDLTQAELQVQRALIQYLVSFTELKLATGTIAQ